MATVSLKQEYAQDPVAIWAVIGNPASAATWIPSLDTSRLEGDVRHVVFTDGNPARECIIDHDNEKRTYTYEYIDGPLPLAKYTSTIRVDGAGSGSIVFWNAEFTAAGNDVATIEKELAEGIAAIYRSALDEVGRLLDR